MSRPDVAVVVPALDEEESIAAVVRAFRERPEIGSVFVVDNGSRDRTGARAAAAGAQVVAEHRRGYGAALRTGIEQALARGAGRLVLVEADETFDASEVGRLLEPLGDHALVLGSRARDLRGALGVGNRLVALGLAALWPRTSCSLTDVGCTYRAFTRATWETIRCGVTADGPEFAPQMVCEAFRRRLRVRELDVRYLPRRSGESKHTGSAWPVVRTALRMLRAILAKRLERLAPVRPQA